MQLTVAVRRLALGSYCKSRCIYVWVIFATSQAPIVGVLTGRANSNASARVSLVVEYVNCFGLLQNVVFHLIGHAYFCWNVGLGSDMR